MVNNQIRAREVRLIDEEGKQVGILPLEEALRMARERNLDLIQITEKVDPPVCKMMNYGKYLYQLKKKEKKKKAKTTGELKRIRLGFNISLHDLETKVEQTKNFLVKGNKIKIEMILRGREKMHEDLAKEKIKKFLESLQKEIAFKIERELKKEPLGLTIIITKG